jgi:ribonuclease HI
VSPPVEHEMRLDHGYTDGGSWPNPGIGGWGAVITMHDGGVDELIGGENPSSNNRMELMGPIIRA